MSKSKFKAADFELPEASEPEALAREALGGEALAMMTGGIVIDGSPGWKFLWYGITLPLGYEAGGR